MQHFDEHTTLITSDAQMAPETHGGRAKCLQRLVRLDMAQNNIGDEGARAFSESLTLSDLNYLDVFGNGISSEGQELLKNAEGLGKVQDTILT